MSHTSKRSSPRSLPPVEQRQIEEDDAVFEACLEHAQRHAAGPIEGLYGPNSLAWQIFREPLVLLGGLRAIALQVAHPAVAAGVAQYSDFEKDLLGRARRTYSSMYHLVFGDLRQAIGVARRLHNIHNQVRGVVEADTAGPWAGRPYRANDPALLLWVWATLFETPLLLYEKIVRPLTLAEKEGYYNEGRLTVTLLGVPPVAVPANLADFYAYYHEMLSGSELVVGTTGASLARALFDSPFTPPLIDAILTAGLLPPRFREAFGLRWGQREQARYERLLRTLRWSTRLAPAGLRAVPAYHQALARVTHQQGEGRPWIGRLINRLQPALPIPFSIRPSQDVTVR
ncbi:MAG TPA: oxygenase MpaB family protein [Anaerolineae bacterium]